MAHKRVLFGVVAVLLSLAAHSAAAAVANAARARAIRAPLQASTRTSFRHVLRPALQAKLASHGLRTSLAPFALVDTVSQCRGSGCAVITHGLNGSIWPVGGYETPLYIGTPAQRQLVQVDTGSADLLVAQVGCKACPKPQYDPTASSTSQAVFCNSTDFFCKGCRGAGHDMCFYNNTYETCDYADPTASCSLVGTTFYDVATLAPGSSVSARVGLGGIQQHTGAFDNEWTNMPGVMGMGYPHLAGVWRDATTFDAWVGAGSLRAVFGMCLSDTLAGGLMTFGGVDESVFQPGTMQYSPIIDKAWYVLNVTDLLIDGVSAGLPQPSYNKIGTPPGTILDSGTNTFVISGEAYDILTKRTVANCAAKPLHGVCDAPAGATIFDGACFAMSAAQRAAYPTVSPVLMGTGPLGVKPETYLLPHPEKEGHYCMGIQSSGPGGFTILGNVFQANYYVEFDQVNTRLGFAVPIAGGCKASTSG